jgi:hypothetical protein
MKTLRSLLAVCAILVIGFISCSKTGDTGPAGPVGPAGPDSVYSSQWINLTATEVDTSTFTDSLITPSVTKSILDSGIILSYVNLADPDGTYHVVPMAGLESLSFYDDYSVGHINIFATSDFSGIPYRYVTIPGSKTIGNGASRSYNGYSATELRLMSYEKVQQVVGNNN